MIVGGAGRGRERKGGKGAEGREERLHLPDESGGK